jgi:hypothetical protein
MDLWDKQIFRSMRMALCLLGALGSVAMVASAQSGIRQNACGPVHDAYNKTFSAGAKMSTKNSGAANVTQAQAQITSDASYQESCKYLREENLNGEATSVYSDVMKSAAGTADAKVWVSKAKGLILQQDVEVDMGAKGKGKQTMVFAYQK